MSIYIPGCLTPPRIALKWLIEHNYEDGYKMNSIEKAILSYLDIQTNIQKVQLQIFAEKNNAEIRDLDVASSTIKETWESVKKNDWNPDLYILLYLRLIANALLFGDDPEVKEKLGISLADLGVKVDEAMKKEVQNGENIIRASKESTTKDA